MRVADTYFVDQKGAFDTQTLIFNGIAILPPQALTDFPDCVDDISDAAMCLAFGLPTSAGIHLMRALEAIVRRYFELVADSAGLMAPTEKLLEASTGK